MFGKRSDAKTKRDVPHQVVSKRHWDGVRLETWQALASPFRPSTGDCLLYRQALGSLSRQNVLLLGATPELRDIFAELGASVVLADQSIRTILAMTGALKHAQAEREVWVKGEWLSLPLPGGFFAAIVGDMVLRQFPVERQEAFFDAMEKLLAPGGKMIMRVHYDQGLTPEDIPAAVKKFFATIPGTFTMTQASVLASEVLDATADRAEKRFSYASARQAFQKVINDAAQPKEKEILERVSRRFFTFGLDMALRERDEVLATLSKCFIVESERAAGDYPGSDFYPLVILRKR
jgi:SAM-dependent methyltransferase